MRNWCETALGKKKKTVLLLGLDVDLQWQAGVFMDTNQREDRTRSLTTVRSLSVSFSLGLKFLSH